ncbi:nose resistant to fluoxetine protein 6-like [Epargyreus clarus]|uniref:nose resistant to fluoxetine protein 6-like n=1 Tax=Epargyreus clarus TaxID=520877 RepID=UPI003C2B8DC1
MFIKHRKMWLILYLLQLLFSFSSAVIYHLNDTEYEQMPPLFDLNVYDSCLRQTGGVYCVARFNLLDGQNNKLMNLIREYSDHTVKHYNHSYLERGICVTKSCKKFLKDRTLQKQVDLEEILEECLNETISRDYGLHVKLDNIYNCDKHGQTIQKDASDWLVALIITVLITMSIIGSLYEIFLNKVAREKNCWKGNQYLLSFSLNRNWKQLTRPTENPQLTKLRSLYSVKCIITFLMVIAHVMWVNSTGFTDNPHDFEKAYESTLYQLIFNGMMIVQIFFVLSGFLLVYNLSVHLENQLISWAQYGRILFMRWWRLTPSNAVMLAFTATWLRHVGSGALWRMRVADSVVADCRGYWWSHLLYINNYVLENRFCAIQTWYISADMQLFAVGIAVFLAIRSRSKILPLSLLLLLGTISPALHVWLQDLDGLVMMTPELYRAHLSDTYFLMHIKGHNNLISFVIGMATGYLVYYMQKEKKELFKNKILHYLTWCIIPSILCLFLSGRVHYADGERPHVAVRMAWASLHRLAMGGIAAFTIVSLVMRCNDKISNVLEWRGWMVPGRLSYSVYLLHINFIHVLLGSTTQLGHVSFYYMVIVHFGIVLISLMAALPFYLLVEAPMTTLMKNLASRHDRIDVKTK